MYPKFSGKTTIINNRHGNLLKALLLSGIIAEKDNLQIIK